MINCGKRSTLPGTLPTWRQSSMPSQRRVRWGSAGQSVLPHGSSSVLALVAVIVALAHCQVAFAATAVIESPATVTAYPAAYATVRFTGASAVVTELVNVTVIGGGTALNSTVVAGNGLDALVEVHLEPTAAAIVLITVPVDASSPPLEKEVSLAITYRTWSGGGCGSVHGGSSLAWVQSNAQPIPKPSQGIAGRATRSSSWISMQLLPPAVRWATDSLWRPCTGCRMKKCTRSIAARWGASCQLLTRRAPTSG